MNFMFTPPPIPPSPFVYHGEELARLQAAYEIDRKAYDRELSIHLVATLVFACAWIILWLIAAYEMAMTIPLVVKVWLGS